MSEYSETKKTNFCKECGNRIGDDKITISSNCETDHSRYRTYGYKFCPNCGKKL